jgi:hypothetical protein
MRLSHITAVSLFIFDHHSSSKFQVFFIFSARWAHVIVSISILLNISIMITINDATLHGLHGAIPNLKRTSHTLGSGSQNEAVKSNKLASSSL